MFNYFKNRYKYFIPFFILGFVIAFYAAISGQGARVFLGATLMGIGFALIIGNMFYYLHADKMSAYGAYFRSFKNIAFVVVLLIFISIIRAITVGN